MFNNIGEKIKGVAKIVFYIEVLAAIIISAYLMVSDENLVVIGIIIGAVIILISYFSHWLLYGFGELIDKTSSIERLLRGANGTTVGTIKSEAQSKSDAEKMKKLDSLRSQGLITEEEYRNALSESK